MNKSREFGVLNFKGQNFKLLYIFFTETCFLVDVVCFSFTFYNNSLLKNEVDYNSGGQRR